VDDLLVDHQPLYQGGVCEGPSGLLLYLDHVEVDLVPSIGLLGYLQDGVDREVRYVAAVAGDELARHRGHRHLLQRLPIPGVDLDGDLLEDLEGLLLGVPVTVDDDRRVDLLRPEAVHQHLVHALRT